MAQKEFKVGNFAKLFNYNVFFGDYLQYIGWAVKNSKTVDTLLIAAAAATVGGKAWLARRRRCNMPPHSLA